MGNGRPRARTLVMKTPFSCLLGIVAALALSGPARPSYAQPRQNPTPAPTPAPAPTNHTITVHFDYDFNRTPACPQAANQPCVQQFVVYDVSNGMSLKRRFQLFTIPVPPHAKGSMRGITGKSPSLPFQSGRHLIAISAQMSDDKTESFPGKCAVWVKVP